MRTSDSNKIMWVAAIGAAIGLIAASFYLPGGDDLYRYYLPFAQGCLHCGFMPYFAQWFLAPLRWLPEYPFSWGVWSLFSVSGILILAYYTKANPFLLLISFPALGQVWLGQVDIFIATGLVVFLFNKNPYLRGLGLIVALSKPQLTALPIFFCLLMEEDPRLFLKLFLIPSIIILQLRYGLLDGQAYTLEEVGRKMGVTRERVRQIEAQALSRLRHPSIRRKLRDYLGE